MIAAIGSGLALGLAIVSVHHIRLRGPMTSSATPTIFSRSTTDPHTAERALLFLTRAEARLPPGTTVAFIWPGHRTWLDDENVFMTAIGFLPRQDVRSGLVLAEPDGPLPEYVVAFDGDFADGRYATAWRDPGGTIYRRRR